jgi:4-coumarate--CoA ligase
MTVRTQHIDAVANPLLAATTLRRLCVSLIRAEQADLAAKGQMGPTTLGYLADPSLSPSGIDALAIDEDGLGFDSLSRLSLILRVNRFFDLAQTGIEDYLLMHRTIGAWVRLLDHHLQIVGDQTRFGFATSGSAGPVKHVRHRIQDLLSEVAALRDGPLGHVQAGARVLCLVPPHHIYGFLFGCLLPQVIGADVVDLSLSGPTAVARQARPGDLIIGTPLNWQLLHDSGITLPAGVSGVTSAGPSTETTWAVRSVNGLAHLTEVYGATETGGVGFRSDPVAPFCLLPHLTRTGTTEVLSTDGSGPPRPVQDRLDWVDDARFRVIGRVDDVVKVAGVNVSPSHVRAILRECDGVIDAAVRLGDGRMRAFVVPHAEMDLITLERQLNAHILRHLVAAARPSELTFGPSLPQNTMGKSCDWLSAHRCG